VKLTRREALALGVGTVALGGCSRVADRFREKAPLEAFALPDAPVDAGYRLLHRAGFGPRPGELTAYAQDGHAATVERLISAEVPEAPTLVAQVRHLDVFQADSMELRDMPEDAVLRQLQQATVLRAVYGQNPLRERLADFWTNHFNIYGRKGLAAWRKPRDEESVVRKHALGKFPEMLRASAESPAMVAYLDTRVNVREQPNENYARELLELHTLGVDGGYTQRDIQEIARCFTGWTLEDRFLRPHGHLRFVPERHDNGEKLVLGRRIPAGGGVNDADRVIEIVCAHPATAKFLARKLSGYFLGDSFPEIEREVAAVYERTGGDIRAMMRPLLAEPAMREAKPILKRPLDLVASSLRALDASTDGGRPLLDHLKAMGQPLYEWPMPDGYPVEARAWSGSMLPRWNYAFALANGEVAGTRPRIDGLDVELLFGALMGRRPAPRDRTLTTAMGKATMTEAAALAIAAPDFQWR